MLLLPQPASLAARGLSLVIALLAGPVTASAQDVKDAQVPFVNGPEATEQHLTFNTKLGGGYDQNVLVDTVGVADPRYHEAGAHMGGGLGLEYLGRGTRVEGGFSGASSFRFYRADEQFVTSSYDVAGNISLALTRHIKLTTTGMSTFSPYYQIKATDDPVLQRIFFTYGIAPRRLRTHQGTARLDFQTGKYSSFVIDGGLTRSDFFGQDLDMQATTLGAHYLHRISRNASVRIGYSEQQGAFGTRTLGGSTVTRIHNLDAGLDFARALVVNPRTLFDFRLGSTALNDGNRTRIEPMGQAALSHRVSDVWAVKLEYLRSLSFVGGYRDVLLSDSLSFGGLARLGRRTSLQLQVGAVAGTIGQDARLDTFSGGGRFRTQLSKNVLTYVESFYYRYRFAGGLAPAGLANMNRGTFSVGIETRLPLIKERNPSVTW